MATVGEFEEMDLRRKLAEGDLDGARGHSRVQRDGFVRATAEEDLYLRFMLY